METKDVVTLLGIIFSFLVGAAGLIISLRNSRKTTFINSITNSRIKYIQDIRNDILNIAHIAAHLQGTQKPTLQKNCNCQHTANCIYLGT